MPVIHIPSSINETELKKHANKMDDFLNSGKDAFILIYMDGCGPCSETHPKWMEIGPRFENQNDIGVFDIEMSKLGAITHEGLKRNIAGYPTIRHVCKDSINEYEDCKEVSHDRSFNSFVDWIETQTKNKRRAQSGGSRKTKRRKVRRGGRRWSKKYKRSIKCRRRKLCKSRKK